jgi:hypothetical protein
MPEAYIANEQIPQAAIDGINREFEVEREYIAGSVRCFDPLWTHPDFVEELGGKRVRLAEAPAPGVVWFLYYNHA